MTQVMIGTVHGKTIVFDEPLALSEGEKVEVIVRPKGVGFEPGAGIGRSAGALAFEFTEEDERILEEIYRARHLPSHREIAP